MKIIQNTPDLLIVESRPWLIAVAMILFTLLFCAIGLFVLSQGIWSGLIFIFVGGGMGTVMLFVFARRVQAVFHRPENWMELRRANTLGKRTVRHPLHEIAHAIVETTHNREGNAMMGRVSLVIETGQSAGIHPLTAYYSNASKHDQIAGEINAWLDSSRPQA